MSRRGACRGGRGAGRRGGMVAGQSVVQDAQNDMYCSGLYGEFYPDNHFYLHGGPPDISQMCTLHHGDYGENLIIEEIRNK